jgi:hypothetical protein
MQQAPLAMRGSLSRRWLILKRANTDAKARMSARVKAVARPATTVAKARTPAKAKGAAALREAHQPALQRQALPHQALQRQAEISASVHDSLQILIWARNRFTGSWRVASQESLHHNSKVASGIRIFKGATGTLYISGTSFVSLPAHIADDLRRFVVSSQSKRDRLTKLVILRPKRSS